MHASNARYTIYKTAKCNNDLINIPHVPLTQYTLRTRSNQACPARGPRARRGLPGEGDPPRSVPRAGPGTALGASSARGLGGTPLGAPVAQESGCRDWRGWGGAGCPAGATGTPGEGSQSSLDSQLSKIGSGLQHPLIFLLFDKITFLELHFH